MEIGVVGKGVVGSAVFNGLVKIGNKVIVHDKLDTDISDLADVEIIFICVPTPSNDDGSCNIKIVKDVVEEISRMQYKGVVAIKSTVEPGTTQLLISNFLI